MPTVTVTLPEPADPNPYTDGVKVATFSGGGSYESTPPGPP
ncbi:MAG: hypothetical protein ACYCXZ_00705 [Coriobacteriia bacterium]